MRVLPFPDCMTLGKLIILSVPQLSNLQNGDTNNSYLTGIMLQVIHEITHIECLERCFGERFTNGGHPPLTVTTRGDLLAGEA